MSVSAVSPLSWRGPAGRTYLNQAYDPAQSFAYTSAYSGVRAESTAATPVCDDGPMVRQYSGSEQSYTSDFKPRALKGPRKKFLLG